VGEEGSGDGGRGIIKKEGTVYKEVEPAMATNLSEAALKQVKQLMTAQNLENVYLRMGVKGGGCSGLSYSLEFDNEVGPHDKTFDIDGVKVVVDAKSYLYLNGITLDYVTQGLTGGFTFVNPNAKSSCGCGTSFSA
jgi:iron-sulfur cluster assembly protein